jgi:hypothetical protein
MTRKSAALTVGEPTSSRCAAQAARAGRSARDIELIAEKQVFSFKPAMREQRERKKKRKSADDRAWLHETQNLFFRIYKRRGLLTRDFILTLAVPIKLSAWG